jgi:23S rRNA (adenine2503-C2)-methyltransferase
MPKAAGTRQGARRSAPPPREESIVVRREPQDLSPRSLVKLYRPDVAEALSDLDSPSYRYAQAFQHFFQKPMQPFSEATVLPADLRTSLDDLGLSTLTLVEEQTAADGTTKILLATTDGSYVESVVMRYRDRVTLCISSQIGCPVGCVFCATGSIGFERNLSVAEIADQARVGAAVAARDGGRVSNVVYMGMGEPLLNLQAVLDSIRVLTNPDGFGLAHRSLSVSTVGIPSGIRRLARAEPQVNLALSLHAPDDETRALLVPGRFRHPIAEILDAAWDHFALTRRKMLVEYVLLSGVNDSVDHARALARLLRGHVVAVNLLAWNPVSPSPAAPPRDVTDRRRGPSARETSHALNLGAPSAATVAAFRGVLIANHIEAVVRQSKGGAIRGACGQLAGRRRSVTPRTGRQRATDS